ncbi:hypothetical protein ALO92_101725 [Pseudomonas congelans]|uniref:Uncharacterized protein n=1 Tax=Pseudomonas congelans TaxID=200452 RepID=A0A0N8R2N2_9PSED|nr:hypothetical protein ALO92_101725 [Pseudomonas congelans]
MEAEQYPPDLNVRRGYDVAVDEHAKSHAYRRDVVVGILSEPSDDQTLISYARLIWVRTPSGITTRLSIRQNV